MRIFAQRLFNGKAFTGPATVEVVDGRIVSVQPGEVAADIRLAHGVLGPGLIDLHNNGAFGVDCATATPEGWDVFVNGLAARGVTSVLPTIITAPLPDIAEAAVRLREAMRRHPGLLGLHLEGPFLAPAKRGAHREDWLRPPDEAVLDELLAGPAGAVLRLITLAPELPYGLEALEKFVQAGIAVSLGHTAADAAQMRAGADAGARLVTHLFNAQSPLGHRAPGAPGAGLTDPRLSPCIIVDGVHVDPALLQIAFAACPRAIAVTDSIALAGLATGATLEFGGALAMLGPDGVGRRADGTIAGAGITLDEGVRRMIAFGIPPETALAAATSRPAAALGLDAGRIGPGALADLVWWSDDFHALQVWQAGVAAPALKPRGTESPRTELMDLEARGTEEIVRLFLGQEASALRALGAASPALARLVDAVAARLAAGGRLFYAGAGTSGRLGFLDAVECRPTFGVEPGLIIPLLAGGTEAFIKAAEGAEDDEAAARIALDEHGFNARDALVGIAASGSTPFTLAALRHAGALGGLTGAIVNNAGTAMAQAAEIAVEIASGPEIIAGSTRLSAGSTEKMALNILSSTVMIRLGKTYGPFMVDMRASNAKLRRRALAMVMALTDADEHRASLELEACGMHVKLAVLAIKRDLAPETAREKLAAAGGSLRRALAV
ncbi:MAG: N-acetylglucosamine-6-phosphate deacetylase [Rhodospirillales bacterium]|nr:N-acetylglucosamine-6-phosphate deacetylase [Rhodospirillales bacterium]